MSIAGRWGNLSPGAGGSTRADTRTTGELLSLLARICEPMDTVASPRLFAAMYGDRSDVDAKSIAHEQQDGGCVREADGAIGYSYPLTAYRNPGDGPAPSQLPLMGAHRTYARRVRGNELYIPGLN